MQCVLSSDKCSLVVSEAACTMHMNMTSRFLMLATWECGLKDVEACRVEHLFPPMGSAAPGSPLRPQVQPLCLLEALGADESLGLPASVGPLRGQDRPEHGLTVLSGHICVGTAQLLRGRQSWSKLLLGARKKASKRHPFLKSHVDRLHYFF